VNTRPSKESLLGFQLVLARHGNEELWWLVICVWQARANTVLGSISVGTIDTNTEEGSSTDYVMYISLFDLQKLYVVDTAKELRFHCH
jgi:hypothetical protein